MDETHTEESWAIWSIARRVESAQYDKAAVLVHTMPSDLLMDIRTALEFMLDIVGNEQRERKNAS